MKRIIIIALALSLSAKTVAANDNIMGGLIGGVLGAALLNSTNGSKNTRNTRVKTTNRISSAQRAENKKLQENLNYFGFNAGTPDGVLGRNSRAAISQMQACLSRTITGKADPFEIQFLEQSAFKAQANGSQTLRTVLQKPNGYCGLLQKYLIELTAPTAPVQPQPAAQPVAAQIPAPVVVTQAPQTVNVVTSRQTNVVNKETNVIILDPDLQARYDRLLHQLKLLDQIEKHIDLKTQDESGAKKLAVIKERIASLKKLVKEIEKQALNKYGTPIKPTNANLGVSAVKASEVFPRVPYFIPGTSEMGELWIKPHITDAGVLMYDFNFVDQGSDLDKIQETIFLTADNLSALSVSMVKINKWSDDAQEMGLRRRYEKAANCFTTTSCEQKIEGNTSTELMFLTYEDGATAAAVRRNKGRYAKSYNLSVESGLLLAAYADYMAEIGSKDFDAATMTDKELDALFQ